MTKNRKLEVKGISITVTVKNQEDFISITDIANGFEGGSSLIEKWIRNKNTIEFLAVWEKLYNPDFNETAYREIIKDAGTNRFVMSAKKWVIATNAIGIMASAGRYGGTSARSEIAFEFATWLNPMFKMLSIQQTILDKNDHSLLFENVFIKENNSGKIDDPYFIYLMQDLNTKFYKIGMSKSPFYREKTLQSENPNILLLCCKEFPTRPEAYSQEQLLHQQYSQYKVRGEWFNFSAIQLLKIEDFFKSE